jgi:hypothetical protein
MNTCYEIYLKYKLYEVLHELHSTQNELNNINAANKKKEDTYKDIINVLQNANLSLLQKIIDNDIIYNKKKDI